MRAVWNGHTLAESDQTIVVEGNHYFPPDSVNSEYLADSSEQTRCPWKGTAGYYDIVAGGRTNEGSAWYYPDPKPAAAAIKGYVAFWRGVQVED